MLTVQTENSIYHIEGNRVMLVAGSTSQHLAYGKWVEVKSVSKPEMGVVMRIVYMDGKSRITTPVEDIQTAEYKQEAGA